MNPEITHEAVSRRIGKRSTWEDCTAKGHTIYDDGSLWFCLICHYATDQSFVAHSRTVLNRAMARAAQSAEAA